MVGMGCEVVRVWVLENKGLLGVLPSPQLLFCSRRQLPAPLLFACSRRRTEPASSSSSAPRHGSLEVVHCVATFVHLNTATSGLEQQSDDVNSSKSSQAAFHQRLGQSDQWEKPDSSARHRTTTGRGPFIPHGLNSAQ
ncbi:hypothetical protein Droror1_Dr00008092 [Drosera rotundifolia]